MKALFSLSVATLLLANTALGGHGAGCGSGGGGYSGCGAGGGGYYGGCGSSYGYAPSYTYGGCGSSYSYAPAYAPSYPRPSVQTRSIPGPTFGPPAQQQQVQPDPNLPAAPKLDVSFNEPIKTYEWIVVKCRDGSWVYAPVLNGLMPQIATSNGVRYCKYDLQLPYTASKQARMKKDGFVAYYERSEAIIKDWEETKLEERAAKAQIASQPSKDTSKVKLASRP